MSRIETYCRARGERVLAERLTTQRRAGGAYLREKERKILSVRGEFFHSERRVFSEKAASQSERGGPSERAVSQRTAQPRAIKLDRFEVIKECEF